jgi:hypothetical protein
VEKRRNFFFFGGTGILAQGFTLAKQALLPLEVHLQYVFALVIIIIFWRRVS